MIMELKKEITERQLMEKYIKAWPFFAVAEVVICIIMAVMTGAKHSNRTAVGTSISDWQSDYITYNNGWYVDESIVQTDDTIDIIYGPYVAVKRGSYSVKIDYICDRDQTCLVYANKTSDAVLKTGLSKLSRSQTSVSYRFTLMDDVDNLEVVVKYNGNGKLRIQNIEIISDPAGIQRVFAIVLFAFIMLDLYVCFRKRIEKNRNIIAAIGGIAFLASMPLLLKGIHSGHDMQFHLMRIEGIVQEIQKGNIPVKLSSLYMDGYGYPVSVYYGDLLLYFPAILRIIGFPVVTAYKIFVFCVNLATSIISYICFKKIFSKTDIALLTSLVYVTARYRMVNLYLRAAVGEYSAMIFLPVIAAALYKIYTDESNDMKLCRKYALILALGMSGLIGTHVLSMEMVCFTMVVLCVVLWKKTLKKHTMQIYGFAVLETIVLNLYFIVPFLDYYRNVDVAIKHQMDEEAVMIQNSGADIGEYFAFFLQNGFDKYMGSTPGIVLMLVFIASIVLWINNKNTKEIKFYTLFSAFLLFVASKSFPWDYLAAHFVTGRLLAQIQFPWRYIGLAVICFAMLLGSIIQYAGETGQGDILKKVYMVIVGASIVMSAFYTSDYTAFNRSINYYDTAEVNTYATGREYIRTGSSKRDLSNVITGENMSEISLVSRDGCHMELYCKAADGLNGTVEVPFFNYKGYHATDENGNEYEITDGNNNLVKFTLPGGFSGKIMVDFIQPWYWRVSEAISLIAAVFLLALWSRNKVQIFRLRNTRKKKG